MDDADFHGEEGLFWPVVGVVVLGGLAALERGVPTLALDAVELADGFCPELELVLEGFALA